MEDFAEAKSTGATELTFARREGGPKVYIFIRLERPGANTARFRIGNLSLSAVLVL
ncbi:MAG TPA: hypothetical protein VLM38_19835 [Blastocatellia bacterium]|nr:hypothetical protein [Blastocatellia bacterium]